jgi:hypothetical protein
MLTMIAAMAARRFVVRADELLTAFGELEAEISHAQASAELVAACQAMPYKLRYNSANCLSRLFSAVFSSNKLFAVAPTAATCNEPSRFTAWRLFVLLTDL